jgi:arginine decarboxylase
MPTAAATREGSTKGREKSGRSKSEPSSTSDLLQPTARIDQFLLMHSARLDNWREITGLAEKWQAGAAQRADLDAAVAAMEAVEGYHAYPGPRLFALLRERIAANDAGGAARLARRISNGLMTRAYRERPSEWDPHAEMDVDEVADVMPPGLEGSERRRPYCEVLFVSAQPAARWPALADEVRRLRRPEDEFVYEPVFVGSFEDAFCAAAVNPGAHLGRGAGRLPVPLALRGAGAEGGAGHARRGGGSRHLGAAPRRSLEAHPPGARRLPPVRA